MGVTGAKPLRSAAQVVLDHLDSVRSGDPNAMAADYAATAVLERPDASWHGRDQIAAYFRTVPQRLGGGVVEFVHLDRDSLQVQWRIVGGPGDGRSGSDHYRIEDGMIAHQTVKLNAGGDF